MTQGEGAKSRRSKAAEKEWSNGLVGDLLRRATSPEVLAGVAGAAAAAHFTKHAVEASEDEELESPQAGEEADQASADTEEEADVDSEHDSQVVTEDEEGDEHEEEPKGRGDEEAESGHGEADDAMPAALKQEETPDRPSVPAEPLDEDDDRMQLLSRARGFAEQLTGHPVESFSGLAQEERGWRVEMEVVEVSRVPSTTDVLASYEVIVTGEGELVDFRRARRYYRNSTDGASP